MIYREQHRFTLLEMLAVSVILLVVMLLGTVSLFRGDSRDLAEKHANELLRLVSDARSEAVNRNSTVKILFDAEKKRWVSGKKSLSVPEHVELSLYGKTLKNHETVFAFYPNGQAVPADLTFSSPDSFARIKCSPVTGQTVLELVPPAISGKTAPYPLWQKKEDE